MAIFRSRLGRVMFNIEERWIYLSGEITQETAYCFAEFVIKCNMNNYAPICVFINSVGGEHISSLMIYSILESSIAPVTTVVVNKARSGAFIISQAGRKRKIIAGSEVGFHETVAFLRDKSQGYGIEKVRFLVSYLIEPNKRLYRIIARRSKLPMKKIKQFFRESRILTARQAKECNLVDEIIKKPRIWRRFRDIKFD